MDDQNPKSDEAAQPIRIPILSHKVNQYEQDFEPILPPDDNIWLQMTYGNPPIVIGSNWSKEPPVKDIEQDE